MAPNFEPHRSNVHGPYYVEDGCCTACGVPEHLAPELFGSDVAAHCFVKRQPATIAEEDSIIRVLATQELGCVRYRGNVRSVLRRIAELGEESQCDVPLPLGVGPIRRDHVSFIGNDSDAAPAARVILGRFVSYLGTRPTDYRTTAISEDASGATFSVCWFEDRFHRIELIAPMVPGGRVLIRHYGPPRFSDTLHDWLSVDGWVGECRWQTRAEWEGAGGWWRVPW